ncbi:hypothetical protein EE612_036407, partial [Oryza sativa]
LTGTVDSTGGAEPETGGRRNSGELGGDRGWSVHQALINSPSASPPSAPSIHGVLPASIDGVPHLLLALPEAPPLRTPRPRPHLRFQILELGASWRSSWS